MTTDSTVMPCMIEVICLGRSALDSGVWTASMNAHRRAANAMPMGLLRPSRAMAMPVNPRPVTTDTSV